MIERRAVTFALRHEGTLFLRFEQPLHDLMEGYQDPLMADSHGAVNQLFYGDPLRTDLVLYLIELAVELDGVIILEGPFPLYAENGIEIKVFDCAVEVLFLFRHYRKAPVVDRQIGDEELACHGRNGSLIFVEPPVDSAGGVIDVDHEDTVGTSAFATRCPAADHGAWSCYGVNQNFSRSHDRLFQRSARRALPRQGKAVDLGIARALD